MLIKGQKALPGKNTCMAHFFDTNSTSPFTIRLAGLGCLSPRAGKSKLMLATFEMGDGRVDGAAEDTGLPTARADRSSQLHDLSRLAEFLIFQSSSSEIRLVAVSLAPPSLNLYRQSRFRSPSTAPPILVNPSSLSGLAMHQSPP